MSDSDFFLLHELQNVTVVYCRLYQNTKNSKRKKAERCTKKTKSHRKQKTFGKCEVSTAFMCNVQILSQTH